MAYIDMEEFEYVILNEGIEVAKHKCKDYESYINGANQFRYQMKNAIRKQPTADVVEVKHGKWEVNVGMNFNKERICSICGEEIKGEHWNFCSNCGAKMDERSDI